MHGKVRGASKAVGYEYLELLKNRWGVGGRECRYSNREVMKNMGVTGSVQLFLLELWAGLVYTCWWSHVASPARWSRLLDLPGVPNVQIVMARCDSSTTTVHEGIPIFVLRMKKQ